MRLAVPRVNDREYTSMPWQNLCSMAAQLLHQAGFHPPYPYPPPTPPPPPPPSTHTHRQAHKHTPRTPQPLPPPLPPPGVHTSCHRTPNCKLAPDAAINGNILIVYVLTDDSPQTPVAPPPTCPLTPTLLLVQTGCSQCRGMKGVSLGVQVNPTQQKPLLHHLPPPNLQLNHHCKLVASNDGYKVSLAVLTNPTPSRTPAAHNSSRSVTLMAIHKRCGCEARRGP